MLSGVSLLAVEYDNTVARRARSHEQTGYHIQRTAGVTYRWMSLFPSDHKDMITARLSCQELKLV